MWKVFGRLRGRVLQLRHFGTLPCPNQKIDSTHESDVGAPKGNADW
ncbi:hypothetical protein QUB33_07055 [Microcoleus sp. B3-A4]